MAVERLLVRDDGGAGIHEAFPALGASSSASGGSGRQGDWRSGEAGDEGAEGVAPDRCLVAVVDEAPELDGCQSFANGVELTGGSINGAPAEEPGRCQALDPRFQADHRGGGGWLRLAGELRWRNCLLDSKRAGLSGGEAVVHIQRSSYGLPVNDRSGGASKGLL